MSELTKNGKNLILENTIVSYSPKDDTIHITSADPDLIGEPFHISLNQSSPTENVLRQLLIEQGVIKEDLIGSNLPDFLPTPEVFNKNPRIFDLGVSRYGIVSWDPIKDSNLGIFGYTGSGKTVLAESILFQALNNQDVWDIYCWDPTKVEYKHVKNKLNNSENYAQNLSEVIAIMQQINQKMNDRYSSMEKEGISSLAFDYPDQKRILFFIDEVAIFHDDNFLSYSETLYHFNNILRKGRAAGIYFVFTSQNPSFIDKQTLYNVPSSVVMGRVSEQDSQMALNSNVAVRTPRIKGRGYCKIGSSGSEPAQFQAYYVPLKKFDEIADKN